MKLEKRDDMRVRRTRVHLWNALMRLLSQRSIEDLTVQEICDHAMVHRTTFYNHFEDKYDLLESGMATMHRRLAETLRPPEQVLSERDSVSGEANLSILFRHVLDQRDFYEVALKRGGNAHLKWRIAGTLRETIGDRLKTLPEHVMRGAGASAGFVAAANAGVIIGVLEWWAERSFGRKTAEELARDVSRMIRFGQFNLYSVPSAGSAPPFT